MQTVVGGIVEVARTSPLANIGNLGDLRRAMHDPNRVRVLARRAHIPKRVPIGRRGHLRFVVGLDDGADLSVLYP